MLLPTVYEDAGISGGTLERPGLQRLLDDIDAGLVDQIVVYKVDRLTRSLSDVAKLVERLEAAGAVFVSVTQSFNTATSMGRLTLHMLLSFAQFEREVTAERIRDKVAASKRKGLWMGGRVPLGYEKDERTLRINEAEAETVRTLYALYRKHGTLRQVKAEADRLRLRTKRRFAADGTRTGGLPFRRGHLHCLLTNPLYAGRIRHQRRVYEGQHPSIIAPELWDAVQAQLQAGAAKPRRRTTKDRAAPSPLAGKLFDETGDRLTPSHTKKKTGQRLRYYVSRRLIQHSGQKDLSGWRLPAPMLEQTVVHLIRQHVDATTFSASLIHTPTMQELASVRRFLDGLCSGRNDDSASAAPLLRLIRRVDISPGSVSILLDRNAFAACLSMGPERIREDALRIHAPFRLRRRGVETKLVLGNPTKSGCLRCLLLVMCTYPFAKKALTLYLARSEGHERYFGCNLMQCKVLASSHQHLMAEAPKVQSNEELPGTQFTARSSPRSRFEPAVRTPGGPVARHPQPRGRKPALRREIPSILRGFQGRLSC